jgi:hypothetical protein
VAVDRYPACVVPDDSLEALVTALSEAQAAAAAIAGETPIGVRAVEPASGRRWYLCAFDGARFLCLDAGLAVERDAYRLHQAAACALMVEHAESLVEQGETDVLASSVAALVPQVEARALRDTLQALEVGVRALSEWSAAPERAVASLSGLETGIRLHDLARDAYERFMEGTEPLVAIQDQLADELLQGLRDVDEAAARAGINRPLAGVIAEAIDALDAGAAEIAAAHIVTVEDPDAAGARPGPGGDAS